MNRRNFLRAAMALPLAAGSMLYGPPMLRGAHAAGGGNKTLVVVFLRGGCDGLNAIVPYGDHNYYDLRPSIAVPPPGSFDGAIDLDGYFGLHPSLAPLSSVYADNRLAILPAVHYAGASRSHFSNQHQIESAHTAGRPVGWMNRYLAAVSASAEMPAIALGSRLPHAMQGERTIPVLPDLGNSSLGGSGGDADAFIERFRTVYGQGVGGGESARRSIHRAGLAMLDNIDALASLNAGDYVPSGGADYPDGFLGRQLRQAAMLIKSGIGVELINIDFGGWDTHASQGGAAPDGEQSQLLAHLAEAMRAFHDDLGSQMNDVMLLTMTEFGRTAGENASGGTDHGSASAWMLMGGMLNGGIHGDWPGLRPGDLVDGRYLDFSIDYRDVLAEVITGHLGLADYSSVIPGHSASPLGLV